MHRPSFTADFFSHLENMVMAAHADPKQQEGEHLRACVTQEPAEPRPCKPLIIMICVMLHVLTLDSRHEVSWTSGPEVSAQAQHAT